MKKLILIVSLILLGINSIKDNSSEKIPFYSISSSNPQSYNLSNQFLNETSDLSKVKPVQSIPNNTDQNWYNSALERIEQEEYNITFSKDLNSYQSPNRANNILFKYLSNGFKASPRETKIPFFNVSEETMFDKDKKYKEIDNWSVELKILNYSSGIGGKEFITDGNKASIENENIRIEYNNSKQGMRQDFIVRKKINDENELCLTMKVITDLKMFVGKDAVNFRSNDGNEKMRYTSLKAWDKNMKELSAYFESNCEDQLSIKVDDRDAVYPVTIDPLSLAPDWSMSGIGGRFGWSLSDAGDVNGDGYDDIMIGASSNNEVFFYYGSVNGLPDTASKILSEGSSGFGEVLSSAGDVNSDGFDDIVIQNEIDGRTVYLYMGSVSGINDTASWILTSNDTGVVICCGDPESLGSGDFNGDGYDDIVIGTGEPVNYQSHNVGAFVFLGSNEGITGNQPSWTASTSPDIYLHGMGWSVSGSGDFNGDGYDDVIVGAPDGDAVLVYYGSSLREMFAPADWVVFDIDFRNDFGLSVSSAGDVNNDGYDDVIIGSAAGPTLDSGKAFIYFGSSTGLDSNDFVMLRGKPSIGGYGYSVSGVSDFNGDGFDDVVVGEGYFSYGAYLYFGNSINMNSTPISLQGFGVRVSGAGDVNNDGFADILTGGEPATNAFYGAPDEISSLQVKPKQAFLQSNSEYCCSTFVSNQFGLPFQNVLIQFKVHGRNTLSDSIPTDINGMAVFCYISRYAGFDTVIVLAENLEDTAYVSWDFPLPVELSSFTSSVSERDITLCWTTTYELNNSGFDIERQSDNTDWIKAGFVNGSGTSNAPVNYSFKDKNLTSGKYNYRLKQIDFNGNFQYYELPEEVSIGIPDKYELSQNYPNPFNPVTNLEFGISELGLVKLKIYDVTGREVVTLVNEIKEPGYYKIKFNAGNLASGVYFYRMTAGDFSAVKKFIVLK